jgi:hypothetical protein
LRVFANSEESSAHAPRFGLGRRAARVEREGDQLGGGDHLANSTRRLERGRVGEHHRRRHAPCFVQKKPFAVRLGALLSHAVVRLGLNPVQQTDDDQQHHDGTSLNQGGSTRLCALSCDLLG